MTRTDDDRRTEHTTTRFENDTRSIPGRTPPTEEAGAPIVPDTGVPGGTPTGQRSVSDEAHRPRTRPLSEGEHDAPLVPDLRPIERLRADDGDRDRPGSDSPGSDGPASGSPGSDDPASSNPASNGPDRTERPN